MKFIADINIPQLLIKQLTDLDHEVLDIKKHSLKISDTEIIKIAQKQSRVVLTRDKDFIILAQFPKYQVPIIAIRLIAKTSSQDITNELPRSRAARYHFVQVLVTQYCDRAVNCSVLCDNKVLEFIKNTKESTIQNSLAIIRDEAANLYQYPLQF